MESRRRTLCLIVATLVLAAGLTATTPLPAGAQSARRDFWIAFPANAAACGTDAHSLALDVSGRKGTRIKVSFPDHTEKHKLHGPHEVFPIDATYEVLLNDTPETKGIHVTADNNIGVTVHNQTIPSCSSGSYEALATPQLGTSYIPASYPPAGGASQVSVVAVKDGTTVTVTPAATIGSHMVGVPFDVLLTRGQTWALRSTSDLSGTRIVSDKPVGVYGGDDCAQVPTGTAFCDMLVEQMPPVSSWGTQFFTVPFLNAEEDMSKSIDRVRIVGSVDGTVLSYGGNASPVGFPTTLNAGGVAEVTVNGALEITASAPIEVVQYERGQGDECTSVCRGDPFMIIVPAVSSYRTKETAAPCPGSVKSRLNVVTPSSAVGAVSVDGVPMFSGGFLAIGTSGYSLARHVFADGDSSNHVVKGPDKLMVMMYGYDDNGGCGFSAVPV